MSRHRRAAGSINFPSRAERRSPSAIPCSRWTASPKPRRKRQAQQLLRVSEARLADLRTGKRPPEVDVTQANCCRRWPIKKADEILKSYEKQYGAGGISLTDLINARAALESATAKVRQRKANWRWTRCLHASSRSRRRPSKWMPTALPCSSRRGSCNRRKLLPREMGWSSTPSIAKANGLRRAIRWSSSFLRRMWKCASLFPRRSRQAQIGAAVECAL